MSANRLEVTTDITSISHKAPLVKGIINVNSNIS